MKTSPFIPFLLCSCIVASQLLWHQRRHSSICRKHGPKLYDRDRDLFKEYDPLCKRVADAGWEPVTKASSRNQPIHVEHLGDRYLTVFNDSSRQQEATITTELDVKGPPAAPVSGQNLDWRGKSTTLTLEPESVALFKLNRVMRRIIAPTPDASDEFLPAMGT